MNFADGKAQSGTATLIYNKYIKYIYTVHIYIYGEREYRKYNITRAHNGGKAIGLQTPRRGERGRAAGGAGRGPQQRGGGITGALSPREPRTGAGGTAAIAAALPWRPVARARPHPGAAPPPAPPSPPCELETSFAVCWSVSNEGILPSVLSSALYNYRPLCSLWLCALSSAPSAEFLSFLCVYTGRTTSS